MTLYWMQLVGTQQVSNACHCVLMYRQLSSGSSSIGLNGSRDIHSFRTRLYRLSVLLSRIQRDLLLASVLLASQNNLQDALKRRTEVYAFSVMKAQTWLRL